MIELPKTGRRARNRARLARARAAKRTRGPYDGLYTFAALAAPLAGPLLLLAYAYL